MEAVEFPQLTDEMLAAGKRTINPEERERPACFSVLTRDVIRRWAYAIGDGNPLWLDDEYAKGTRWGAILSPPTFPETAVRGPIFNPLRAPRAAAGAPAAAPSNLPGQTSSRGGGFPGLAGLQVGREFTFYAPVRVNEEIRGMQRVVAIVDSEGRTHDDCIDGEADVDAALAAAIEECAARKTRIAIQTFDIKVYSKRNGKLLMRCFHHMGRFARGIPLEESKYRDVPEPYYTQEMMDKLVRQHEQEYLRGRDVLYWEDVKVGDELPGTVKGPHTPNDYILYHASFGGFFDVTDRLKYLMMKRFPGTVGIDPKTNVPDFPISMHLDEFFYKAMGYPRGFDGSMQRISWFGHLITNWMGDDAFLQKLAIFHHRPLFLYDMMWLHGRVVSKDERNSAVDLELWSENQRGEPVSHGTARVLLQNRAKRPLPFADYG